MVGGLGASAAHAPSSESWGHGVGLFRIVPVRDPVIMIRPAGCDQQGVCVLWDLGVRSPCRAHAGC